MLTWMQARRTEQGQTDDSKGIALASVALRAAILTEQCVADRFRTAASVSAAAVALVAALVATVLTLYEHQHARRPPSLLLAYLFVSVLFESVKARTYWRLPDKPATGITIANCCVTALFFGLEAVNKTFLLVDHLDSVSKEGLSGPISKSFFLWLNGLFRRGYKNSLLPADLAPIDRLLYSETICPRFEPLFKAQNGRLTQDPSVKMDKADARSRKMSPLSWILATLYSDALRAQP